MTRENRDSTHIGPALMQRLRGFSLQSPEVRQLSKYIRTASPSKVELDSEAWVSDMGILRKRLLYLDTRFWIDMADGRDHAHTRLREMLRSAVSEGQMLCPASSASIMELARQTEIPKRAPKLDLLDELSQKVCLKPQPGLFIAEVLHIASCEMGLQHASPTLPRTKAYVPIAESCLPLAATFGNSSDSPTDAPLQAQLALSFAYSIPTKDWIELAEPSALRSYDERFKKMASYTDAMNRYTKESTKPHKEFFEVEMKALERWAAEVIRSRFAAGIDSGLASPTGRAGISLFVDTILDRGWLRLCPSLRILAELSAARRREDRFVVHDIFDTEHATRPIPYADCVALDKHHRHLCRDVLRLPAGYGTVVTSNVKEVIAWVESAMGK